jgi:hypothetical protein
MKQRLNLNDSKEDIYDAYQRALNNLRVEKHRNQKHIEHKKEIVDEKNKRYNTLKWKYFRMTQILYGLNIKINGLKQSNRYIKSKGKKIGYQMAIDRINKVNFSPSNAYKFLAMCNFMTEATGYSLSECSFLLWGNQYDFFSRSDFNRDIGDSGINYYYLIYKFKKLRMIEKIDVKRENGRLIYCLNAIGRNEANRIHKFTKKIK